MSNRSPDRKEQAPRREPPPAAYPDSGRFMRMIVGFAALAIIERLPHAVARRLRARVISAVAPEP